ncbi:hypothetical protein Tco_1428550 [Tanacetum coccineum]
MGLESLEARIVIHEKNEAVYEENIEFLKYDVQVKDISIKDLKNQLEETLKEKDNLKIKLEKFEESSKNLSKLINSQISAKDKTGLGYDGHMNESEVVHSRESDVDDNPVNDRFKTNESVFKSVVRKTTTSVPETETSISKTSKDNYEKPKTVVATKSGQVPVNAAKQSSQRAATSISIIRPVNTTTPKPKVNDTLHTTYSYFKAHSPHAGFGDQQEMLLTISPKTVNHTCLKDLTMLIYKADSDGISDEFGVKTGSCKVNASYRIGAARAKVILKGKNISPTKDPTPRQGKRGRDTKIPQSSGLPKKVGDEAIYTEEDDRVVRATTTATSLEAEQESGNIHKTQSTATLNEPSPQEQETDQQADPRSQYTILGMHDAQLIKDSMEHQDDLTDFVPPTPHDSPLSGGHTLGSDEGRQNINELIAICTKLSNRVLAVETSKNAQDLAIKKLKKKVKRLEKKLRARTPGMKLFKIGTSRRKSLDKENAVSAASAIILVLVYRISNAEQEKPPQQTTTAFEKMRILLLLKHFPSKNDAISVAPQYSRRNKETVSIDEQARFLVETVAKRKRSLAAQRG